MRLFVGLCVSPQEADLQTWRQGIMKKHPTDSTQIRNTVRERYSQVAGANTSCCAPSCCGPTKSTPADEPATASLAIGYSPEELAAVPEGANLGLGCGNPQAIAALQPGETVLDLGSGAGFDAFLAAQAVGAKGRVIGVDMTPEMIAKAQRNAAAGGYGNVEFREGEIENLPIADATVDVIISNCVINLSPDKPAVFREAYRVLRPGGRLAISDVIALAPIPGHLRQDWELYTGCVAGASTVESIHELLLASGFREIRIQHKGESAEILERWFPGCGVASYVASATIEAIKMV